MKIEEAIAILKQHNKWRRGADILMTDPKILGEAIDCVVDYFADISKNVLTWQDIKKLENILTDMFCEYVGRKDFQEEEYYKEALKRFNEK